MRDEYHLSHPQALASLVTTPSTFPDYEIYDDDEEGQENYQILQDGYKGIGALSHPGLHDDRPPYRLSQDEDDLATFGGLKFQLPTDGTFPDRPMIDDSKAVLRDLPDVDQLDYEESGKKGRQYGKSYLQNPYGADFIRLEIDSNRYKHNKTRPRLGGIHHIPLKIHGYAETSEYPVSSDTERPIIRHRPRPMRKNTRPKKQVTKPPETETTEKLPLKAMHDAMEKLPNAINHLPNIMQSLVSNHASWIDKVWASALNGEATGKSFDNVAASTSSLTLSELEDQST